MEDDTETLFQSICMICSKQKNHAVILRWDNLKNFPKKKILNTLINWCIFTHVQSIYVGKLNIDCTLYSSWNTSIGSHLDDTFWSICTLQHTYHSKDMNVVSISSVMRDVCRQNNACEAAICYFAVPQQIHQSPQYIYRQILRHFRFCCVCVE